MFTTYCNAVLLVQVCTQQKGIVIITMLWLSQLQHNLTLSFTSPTLYFTSPTLSFYLALEAEYMYAIHSVSVV